METCMNMLGPHIPAYKTSQSKTNFNKILSTFPECALFQFLICFQSTSLYMVFAIKAFPTPSRKIQLSARG
jgi:hypothetical protein